MGIKLIPNHNRKVFKPKYLIQVLLVHGLAVWAIGFHFSWTLLIAATAVGLIMAYSMGIFHHMQFTHDSFKSKKWVSYLGGLLGTLTWRGPMAPPLKYAAMHNVHHEYADTPNDPHSPTGGIFHAFMGWFWQIPYGLDKPAQYEGYIPEAFKHDKVLQFMDRNFDLLQLLWALLMYAIGGWIYVAYFVGYKTVLVIWVANAVDVINHTRGYRNFDTADDSTNSFLMAAVHLGGAISWHNNHHAVPECFYVKKKWWEIDAHYVLLRVLQSVGLVSDIKKKVYD